MNYFSNQHIASLKQPRIDIRWYALGDCIANIISWISFYFLRKYIIQEAFVVEHKFYLGIVVFPSIWLIVYYLVGSYKSVRNKRCYRGVIICIVLGS